ncbi:MAG: M6 family metalloprotease domain-containing protein [Bacteroidaceae bacterium]|nr:M6 family metalloprotease domain-containing protein [Bacteroidaceae bacterium]
MRTNLLSLLLVFSTMAWGGKALSVPTTITQPDGSRLTVILYGDEHFHWAETLDGVVLYQQGTAYYIATADANGALQPTAQLAHERNMRSHTERALIGAQQRTTMLQRAQQRAALDQRRREPVLINSTFIPHTGSPRVLVVLAQFADQQFSVRDPRATFEQYLNSMEPTQQELGNAESLNSGSVKKYFHDSSFGQFTPQFDIVGPVTLPGTTATYGQGRNDRMDLLIPAVCEAVKALEHDAIAPDTVNFADYDSNGDGIVDLLYIIYAGYGANITGNSSDCIWPKSGIHTYKIGDNLSTSRYGVNSELNAYPDAFSSAPYQRVNGIGMFCHEFSHCMGLPDFYPTTSSAQIDNQALEYWSLMDGGELLRNGWAPCSYTAWEREAMGWMTIEELTADTTITLLPIDQEGGKAFRIRNTDDATNCEYFIIENIQQQGWNSRHYGHGLLVFHVSYEPQAFSVYPLGVNSVNNVAGRPRMTIVPADGLLGTSYNKGKVRPWGTGEGGKVTSADYNNQHAGDPYPGTAKRTELSADDNTVNYAVYTGRQDWAIIDIKEQNGTVTLTFLRDKTTSGIHGLTDKQTNDNHDNWYTLEGRRLTTMPTQRGIYIKGNKKVVIR